MEKNKTLKRFIMTSTFAGAFLAAPLIGEASLGDQTLKLGKTHNDVKELQSILKSRGYFKHKETTSYFGPITRKAVMDFQRSNGLVVDGIVGKNTYSKLLQKSNRDDQSSVQKPNVSKPSIPNKPAVTTQTGKVLKLNSTGKEVKKLQEDLKYLGFFTFYKTTEFYGTITTEAVRKFQISQRIKATGVADAATLAKVQKQVAAKKQTPAPSKPAPSKPTSPNNTPVKDNYQLKFGSKGAEVVQLQTRLKKLGYFTYPMITDYFGMVTEESVEKFQKANGLPVTGIVNTTVLNKITEVEKKPVNQPIKSRDQITINVIANATELMGVPYVWGGTTTRGFDCSGFIQYVFAKEGVKLPRTTAQMWNATTYVSKPAVGDLVFFETYTTGPSHLGIYIGNNQFVHSGSSTGVTVSNLNTRYWQNIYLGSKRINY
ncbi:peptidoglycan-binding protein [Fictibacillus nanhaiensis]|uniref:C40 family peptidase n=1 Tax=Fictibacillus nanhaiensis TaxID=742169 RepID=UPI003C152299